ncbi:hypothetical protein HDE_09150 [Halotydeus destructor]|nr:hypothetical protein HDE_09150 [Halotydeus destructor]
MPRIRKPTRKILVTPEPKFQLPTEAPPVIKKKKKPTTDDFDYGLDDLDLELVRRFLDPSTTPKTEAKPNLATPRPQFINRPFIGPPNRGQPLVGAMEAAEERIEAATPLPQPTERVFPLPLPRPPKFGFTRPQSAQLPKPFLPRPAGSGPSTPLDLFPRKLGRKPMSAQKPDCYFVQLFPDMKPKKMAPREFEQMLMKFGRLGYNMKTQRRHDSQLLHNPFLPAVTTPQSRRHARLLDHSVDRARPFQPQYDLYRPRSGIGPYLRPFGTRNTQEV